ncbi:ATP-grasp domain-containing protein [Alkalicoccus daliensis]|uniref:ATP-grasp domain-containing protein n=1 Tax=Alkalicoccus daliensis TaxID=745820 RepID=A0A1H0K408_9BACI|nr:alpha-L-glutamate ligase [Alkalicoccus daliensis]SDO50818.1 ATP-grasp domain-containing protein [Alkalicoccus daliensis]
MKKVYILHENREWTQPLLDALTELDVPHEDWHLHEGIVPLDEEPPDGIFYNRMSASSHSRGHRYAPELTEAVLSWLERHDRVVLNGTRALYLEVSKVAQYEALKKHGIPVPQTIAAVGENQLLQAAEKMETPFITKHNRAGKGLGVQRFNSVNSLKETLASGGVDPSIDGVMLLQQYIDAPASTITRCEFINGKFMYAVQVDTSEGFELCPADACQIGDQFCPTDSPETKSRPKFEILPDFQSPLIQKYEAFLKENQITFAGIEQITDAEGRTYTYDVNTNTNYNKDAEAAYGVYGMKEMAKALQSYAGRSAIRS